MLLSEYADIRFLNGVLLFGLLAINVIKSLLDRE